MHDSLPLLFAAALLAGPSLSVEAKQAAAQTPDGVSAQDPQTSVVALKALSSMDYLLDQLASKRVIFVGEMHDRYEDHLNQLAVIRGLQEQGKDLAIGMEQFQQPFQAHLDAYVRREISEKQLLRETEYFDRWRFDYRHYRPILSFARERGIPLVALNLEREITQKVGQGGIDSLSEQERARVPSMIDREDEGYRARIKSAFEQHPQAKDKDFEHFLDVQLLWDEGMAERAAEYLQEHPEKTLVILAGSGHLEYGQGIPKRLLRRVPAQSAILLNGTQRAPDPDVADYLLYPRTIELPAPGMLGILLESEGDGEGMVITGFAEESGAKVAGIEEGDRILKVGQEPIASYGDIRIALLGRAPGDKVAVEVLREHLVKKGERLQFEVELR